MKIIDLLNKIANNEEIPKKIRVHYRVFEKYLNHNAYLNTEDEENYKYLTDLPRLFDDDRDWLNEEVEIIEEEPRDIEVCGSFFTKSEYNKLAKTEEDKKIEKIKNDCGYDENLTYEEVRRHTIHNINFLKDKINELIDKVNNLENKE